MLISGNSAGQKAFLCSSIPEPHHAHVKDKLTTCMMKWVIHGLPITILIMMIIVVTHLQALQNTGRRSDFIFKLTKVNVTAVLQ